LAVRQAQTGVNSTEGTPHGGEEADMLSQYNIEKQAQARQGDIRREARRNRRLVNPGWAPIAHKAATNRRLAVVLGRVVVAALLAGLALAMLGHGRAL
jgi:hypothetical protein